MNWTKEEEKELLKVYVNFRKDIIKGNYPSEFDFNSHVDQKNFKKIVHPFKSCLMRLKNMAACDGKVKHDNVLSNVAAQTVELCKKLSNEKLSSTKNEYIKMPNGKFGMPWFEGEEKQLFIIYIKFRESILKGVYPNAKEFVETVKVNKLTKIEHPFKSCLMRLKNIASCDPLVKHEEVLENTAAQTRKLAKFYFE